MLGFLIPDALQRLFVTLAGKAPLEAQGMVFALCCTAFLMIASALIRRGLLRADVALATASQRRGSEAGFAMALATGWAGVLQWRVMLLICVVYLIATGIHEAERNGAIRETTVALPLEALDAVHRCLRPGSGQGADRLSGCISR